MICMAFAMIIVGCKKVDVNFTYSPSQPKAGQAVKFTNTSSAGEKWSWDFGDKSNMKKIKKIRLSRNETALIP